MTVPGWYPDPSDATNLRYFDGTDWTAHTTTPAAARSPEAMQRTERRMAAISHLGVPFMSLLLPLALWWNAPAGSFVRLHARQAFSLQSIFAVVWMGAQAVTIAALFGADLPLINPLVGLGLLAVVFLLEIPQIILALRGRAPIPLIPWPFLPK